MIYKEREFNPDLELFSLASNQFKRGWYGIGKRQRQRGVRLDAL